MEIVLTLRTEIGKKHLFPLYHGWEKFISLVTVLNAMDWNAEGFKENKGKDINWLFSE